MNIHGIGAPFAAFADAQALATHHGHVKDLTAALHRLAVNGPDGDAWRELRSLGMNVAEIQEAMDGHPPLMGFVAG